MGKNLLVLLPGIRYGVDCPLLYYTRTSYTYAGYEVMAVDDYEVGGNASSSGGKETSDDLNKYADRAAKNVVKRFRDLDFSEYEHVVFAEKSVGTVIGMMLEKMLGADNIYHILYTPIDGIYSFLTKEEKIIGIAAGTADKHIEMKALRAAAKKLDIPLLEIKNAGHRLESGRDATKDIGVIAQVIGSIGDPKEVIKLDKKLAALQAAGKKEEENKNKRTIEPSTQGDDNNRKTIGSSGQKEEQKKPTGAVSGKVRKYRSTEKDAKKHLEEMMEIWLQCNVKEQDFIPKKYWSKNYKEVMRVMDLATVYVYETDGKIVGFTGSMEEAMVAISVAEGYRSLGIGTKLLDKLKDDIGKLETTVYTKNKRALEFFNKNEFSPNDIQIEASTGQEIVLLSW